MTLGPCQKTFCTRRACRKLGTAAAVLALSVAHGAQAHADDVSFSDFPYVVYCNYEGIDHAYYFSQLGPDGRVIYLTPDRQLGAISIDGVAERVGGDQSGSCLGKTLEELRSAGQAFDLPR